MRNVAALRVVVPCLLGLLGAASSCASEDEPMVRHVGAGDGRDGGGDGDGDGDGAITGDGDGDGDEDAGGDGDGDGDLAFTYEVVPAVRGTERLVPADLSDDGHVLLLGDNGENLFSQLFIWDGGTSKPRPIEVPDDYVVAPLSLARLLTGDRIALSLLKSNQVIFAILDDGEVHELMSPGGEPQLNDANNAGQIVVSIPGSPPRTWLLSMDELPILIEEPGVMGITEAGLIGFSSGYWEDEEFVDDVLELDFYGRSGPSEQMTVLGFDGLPNDTSPAAIWDIERNKVEPIARLRQAKDLPRPMLMLPNGDYVVKASYGTPRIAAEFLFHDGRYELLEIDDDIKLASVAGNANGDLVATSEDEDFSAVLVRPR